MNNNYSMFSEVTVGNKTFVTSVRDPYRSKNFKQLSNYRWQDMATGRIFDTILKDVSQAEAKVFSEFYCAGYTRVGYRKVPNKN